MRARFGGVRPARWRGWAAVDRRLGGWRAGWLRDAEPRYATESGAPRRGGKTAGPRTARLGTPRRLLCRSGWQGLADGVGILSERARLLGRDAAVWSPRRWVVSDFWFDQSAAFAEAWLPAALLPAFQQRHRELRTKVAAPRLTVLLDGPADQLLARVSSRGRTCERRLTREQLERIRQAVVRRTVGPDAGPVLRSAPPTGTRPSPKSWRPYRGWGKIPVASGMNHTNCERAPAMTDGGIDLLELSERYRQQLEAGSSAEERKRKGQYFTPNPVCRFMASLFSKPGKDFRLLDPGAGVGSLTAAFCTRWSQLTSPRRLEVHLFENDPAAVSLLEKNMEECGRSMRAAGHQFRWVVHATDFIAAVGEEFNRPRALFREVNDLGHFDGVIMNPPYFKIGKDSAPARLMASIVHGQPNVYALFLALATHVLRPGGELVAITPRSFCNGLYFRGFRKWFLQRMSLEHLHVFESRTETFQRAGVLQENIVMVGAAVVAAVRRCSGEHEQERGVRQAAPSTDLCRERDRLLLARQLAPNPLERARPEGSAVRRIVADHLLRRRDYEFLPVRLSCSAPRSS